MLRDERLDNPLGELKSTESLCQDGEHLRVLRKIVNSFVTKIATSPEHWRIANVTLVFKRGSKGEPGNYNPLA